jgi:putative membrane protein
MKRISVAVIALTFGVVSAQQTPPASQTPAQSQQQTEQKQAPERQNPATTQQGEIPRENSSRQDRDGNKDSTQSAALENESFTFIEKAARSNTMEIRNAELAAKQATREDVKNFAQMLVTDHTKSLEELKTLARQKGMTWPADAQLAEHHATDKNADKEKAGWDRVTQAQGAEFDRMFLKNQIDHHKRNIKEFERTSRNHSDSDIRAFATKTLPTLQGHLQQAQALSKNKVNRDTTSGSNN